MGEISHVDKEGKARMVDVGSKEKSVRKASAACRVILSKEAYRKVKENSVEKGDVLSVSRIAGIQGAKRTPHMIPLCHPLLIDHIDVGFELNDEDSSVVITTTVSCKGKTGVEMEAMTGTAVAALTVYDMVKAIDRAARITDLRLLSKEGGKSGKISLE